MSNASRGNDAVSVPRLRDAVGWTLEEGEAGVLEPLESADAPLWRWYLCGAPPNDMEFSGERSESAATTG